TNAMQVNMALRAPKDLLENKSIDVMVWLFAQEIAVDEVPKENIIAAIKVTRAFKGTDWKDGGTYTLVGSKPINNGNCTVPEGIKTAAMTFMDRELREHRTDKLPDIRSGYHPSEPSALPES
ncbi:MAG: hypothetical protein JOZ29_21505, partial [Deltaproteobacteria bacterium]|nr:hypothetical protein [Deltaproteobacteria bacterium]